MTTLDEVSRVIVDISFTGIEVCVIPDTYVNSQRKWWQFWKPKYIKSALISPFLQTTHTGRQILHIGKKDWEKVKDKYELQELRRH